MSRSLLERLAALEQSVRRPTPASGKMEPAASAGRNANDRADVDADCPDVDRTGLDQSPSSDAGGAQSGAATFTATGLEQLGFCREDDGLGPIWHRELRYDILTWHGNGRFLHLLECDLRSLMRLTVRAGETSSERVAASDPVPAVERMRFYDTETTGLGSGAGTFPFLHAIGLVEGDEWVIHQYLLVDYTEEATLLATLHQRHFEPGTVVVSYNGRSFDWPLLLNRFVLYRLSAPTEVRQLDLMYPCRRLWKKRLGRTNLAAIEGEILGVRRINDLPGHEAPARYFEFVSTRDAARLEPVCDHNAADVSSLARLAAVLAETLNGGRTVETAAEYTALARWYGEWGEYDLAEHCLAVAVGCPDAEWQAYWLRSLLLKRQQRWQEAQEVWTEMAQQFSWAVAPLVELAKLAEHREKDWSKAMHWTRTALARLEKPRLGPDGHGLSSNGIRTVSALTNWRAVVAEKAPVYDDAQRARIRGQLLHRLQRLERKMRQDKHPDAQNAD
ncbi:ribonuclease H-like domain-containing protein [Alicyclobacillus herbarius]|uniref:ribonuclease H-like domain-containing protein n=1 Tax=Alicyclobacillus herbarius TaxID=122960 RepID=UPI000683F8BA|nr:ribonuclease H-like domain-containing protein [Alicyclobacillus herbarius]